MIFFGEIVVLFTDMKTLLLLSAIQYSNKGLCRQFWASMRKTSLLNNLKKQNQDAFLYPLYQFAFL